MRCPPLRFVESTPWLETAVISWAFAKMGQKIVWLYFKPWRRWINLIVIIDLLFLTWWQTSAKLGTNHGQIAESRIWAGVTHTPDDYEGLDTSWETMNNFWKTFWPIRKIVSTMSKNRTALYLEWNGSKKSILNFRVTFLRIRDIANKKFFS